jgi:uncharacterized protein YpmB
MNRKEILMFKIGVVIVVIVIIGLFAYGAYRAEKVVAQQAKDNLEASRAQGGSRRDGKKGK